LLTGFVIASVFAFNVALSQEYEETPNGLKKGFIGILYDDTNLSRPVSIWILEKLDSKQMDWESRNDFSAKWQGLIKAPISGEVTFYAEADNGIQLHIDGKQVLSGWGNGRSVRGRIKLREGQFYPIDLSYRQVSGSSYLRLYWQWENHPKSIIPEESIWHTREDELKINEEYDEAMAIPLNELEFDVASIMEINSTNDIIQKRDALIEFIFGNDGIPVQESPNRIHEDIFDQDFKTLTNLSRIDKLEVEMEWNLNSIAYHFVPDKSIKKAIIYHQGHRGKFVEGISTIQAFLSRGYNVIALSMPLKGYNRKPIVNFERFGKMMIVSHEQMCLLTPESGHPVRYFLEPVMVMVNYLEKLGSDQIMMIGISGGGWTTTMCGAMDPRILKSFPVAGSLPFYLRARDIHNQSTFGDYEQYVPEVYRIANYLDLYILGAFGDNRRQLQILNQYDSCCFDGTGYTTYVDLIKSRMSKIGKGDYDVYLDSSHREHKISDAALEIIFKELTKE
jgi:hypothetical protein